MKERTTDLKQAIRASLDTLEGLEIESSLREIAFAEVLRHLLANPSVQQKPGAAPSIGTPGGAFAEGEVEKTSALTNYLNVSAEAIDAVYDLSGPEPGLSIHSSKLDKAKTRATHQIGLLICAARAALGMECTTDDIRTVLTQYGKYDQANFAAALANAHGLTVKGLKGSSKRTVRLTVPGKEEASELVKALSER